MKVIALNLKPQNCSELLILALLASALASPILVRWWECRSWQEQGIAANERGQFEVGLACFRSALRLEPNNAEFHLGCGNSLRGLAKYREALAEFDIASNLRENYASAFNNKGLTLDAAGDAREARKAFDKAIQIDPKSAAAYNNRGTVEETLRLTDLALADYSRAIDLDPTYDAPLYNRGRLRNRLGLYEGALDDLSHLKPYNAERWHAESEIAKARRLASERSSKQEPSSPCFLRTDRASFSASTQAFRP
jgi:tetratricopeptide (TPR) repeat protein